MAERLRRQLQVYHAGHESGVGSIPTLFNIFLLICLSAGVVVGEVVEYFGLFEISVKAWHGTCVC